MNGKIPHNQTDWTWNDLKEYGFKPHTYYTFEKSWHRRWYNLFGDRFFDVPKILTESQVTLCYEDYQVCCDEWGYVDVFYSKEPRKYGTCLAQLGKRDVVLSDIFDVIKEHKRALNLEKFFDDELV